MLAPGSRSDGFNMRVFPVTAAMGIVHSGIMLERVLKSTLCGHKQDVRREIERRNASTNS